MSWAGSYTSTNWQHDADQRFSCPSRRLGHVFELAMCWGVSSMSANSLLDGRIADCVPFRVRTARRECLDHLLILGRRHLERVLREFAAHYNAERPHRGLRLAPPSPPTSSSSISSGAVRSRDRLGGLVHEYYREVA
jgi:hypothetical protein